MKKLKKKILKKLYNESHILIKIYYALIILTFILLIPLVINIQNSIRNNYSIDNNKMIDLNSGWKNKDGKEININPFISNNGIEKNNTYTLYHQIPKTTNIGDSLCFRGLSTDINIYIGNKKILDTPYKENIFSCKSSGSVWYFYTFTKEDLGKTLRMTIKPFYNDTSCYIDKMYIGNSTTYLTQYISSNVIPMIIATLIFFLGLVYIIIDIYININQKINRHTLLYIGIFSLLLAFWSILATHVIDFIPSMSQPVQFLACLLLYIIPSPALLFTNSHFNPNKKNQIIVNITMILTIILYLLALLLQLTNISDLHETLFLSHTCIVINSLSIILTFISVYKQSRKVKKKEKKPLSNAIFNIVVFSILISCFIADIFIFYSTSNSNIGIFTRIAALFFILYLGILAFQNLYVIDKDATHAKFVQKLAYTDGLTNIGNRTSFQEKINYIEQNISNYKSVGIITFDVNNLKVTNDNLGHDVGDDLIISASNIIKQSFEEFATVYRIGGDEFAAIIEKNNAEAVYKVCALQFNVNIQNFNNFYNKPYTLSIAHGSSFYHEGITLTIKDVLKQSDVEMYKNKEYIKKKLKEE